MRNVEGVALLAALASAPVLLISLFLPWPTLRRRCAVAALVLGAYFWLVGFAALLIFGLRIRVDLRVTGEALRSYHATHQSWPSTIEELFPSRVHPCLAQDYREGGVIVYDSWRDRVWRPDSGGQWVGPDPFGLREYARTSFKTHRNLSFAVLLVFAFGASVLLWERKRLGTQA
jgi:hypothetical protein